MPNKIHPRIPPAHAGIQVNTCKLPACPNFGIPAIEDWEVADPRYRVVAHRRKVSAIVCKHCGEIPALKSNVAIFAETARLLAPLMADKSLCCPRGSCPHHQVPVGTRGAYQRWSSTQVRERWRCNDCGHTFSVKKAPMVWERDAEKNGLIFRALINSAPMRRVAKIAIVPASKVYERLRVFDKRCTRFAAARERTLIGKTLPAMRLQCDRQDFILNWMFKNDLRNVQLSAVSSADSVSGFIFGATLNYDAGLDAKDVNADALAVGDLADDLPYAHRKWARVWLDQDYLDTVQRKTTRRAAPGTESAVAPGNLPKAVAAEYEKAAARDDVETPDEVDEYSQLPVAGMQLHSGYVLHAHFLYVATLLSGAERVDYDMDLDSGMRAAYLSAFKDRIVAGTSDGYYLRINKNYTNDEREEVVGDAFRKVLARQKLAPEKSRLEIHQDMIRDELTRLKAIGKWSDRWLVHPMPSKNEPEKMVCWLSDDVLGRPPRDEMDIVEGYRRSSMDALNRFFEQVRRSISLLERPIATASEQRRVWRGRSAYNPRSIVQLLNIFRTYHNYCFVGADGQTPAMRLGLSDRVYTEMDLISHGEYQSANFAMAA